MKFRIMKDDMYFAERYIDDYGYWKSIPSTLAFTKWGCKNLLNKYIKLITKGVEVIEEFEI